MFQMVFSQIFKQLQKPINILQKRLDFKDKISSKN